MGSTFIKDPDAVLDYQVDWSRWLSDGETIVESYWVLTSGDVVIGDTGQTDTASTVWLSGGTEQSTLTNRIVTSDGREDTRSFTVLLNQR